MQKKADRNSSIVRVEIITRINVFRKAKTILAVEQLEWCNKLAVEVEWKINEIKMLFVCE